MAIRGAVCLAALVAFSSWVAVPEAVSLAASLGEAAALREGALISSWSRELDAEGRGSPIHRVLKLLKEMEAQLAKESASDSQAYDTMVCWCETNDKEKTQAIQDGEATTTDLLSQVQAYAARDGEVATKIETLKQDIAERKLALSKATELRERAAGEFRGEEKELVQAVTMLKNAIIVLSRKQAGLLQVGPELQESVGSALRFAAFKHEEMLQMRTANAEQQRTPSSQEASFLSFSKPSDANSMKAMIDVSFLRAAPGAELPVEFASRVLARAAAPTSGAKVAGASFSQEPEYFDSKATHLQNYAPQAGQIIGILKQMKEEMESNMSTSGADEKKAAEDYVQLKAASEEQLATDAKDLDSFEEEFGANTKALSDAKENLGTTRETLAADRKFLSDLRLKCQDLDTQWAERSKARSDELVAVKETIAILAADDTRDLFHKKLGGSSAAVVLLQLQEKVSKSAQHAARNRAVKVLLRAAKLLRLLRQPYQVWHGESKPHEKLSAMAVQVQLDSFSKVKEVMATVIAQLKDQQEEEVKHKAYCETELNENELQVLSTKRDLKKVEDKIAALESAVSTLTQEIADAKEQIAETQVQVKKASERRETENSIYQEEITDQRLMQQILKKAITRMAKVYKKTASMAQEEPEPPVQFQPYKKNAGSSPVMSLLEKIVSDSQAVEKEAVTTEKQSQEAYETFVTDANSAIAALSSAITTKSDAITAAQVDKTDAEARQKTTSGSLEDLSSYLSDLHEQCDFVLRNFDIRQKSRLDEMDAIQSAMGYLSGMSDEDGGDADSSF